MTEEISQRIKVLQVLPELNTGGVERGTIEVGDFLTAQGHESLVVSNGGSQVERLERGGSRHIALPVHRKSASSLLRIRPFRSLLQREKPDILHIRSRVPGWIAYLAWRKLPMQDRPCFVSTVHGFNSVNRYSEIMTRGQRVIAVSESIREYVLANYTRLDPDLLRVIHRGVDTAEYHPEFQPDKVWLEMWYREYPKTKGMQLLTLPGRITRLKGHEKFINLFKHLDQSYHGLIVGGVHPKKTDYFNELQNQVRHLDLQNRITFTGNRTDLREILSISAVVFSLSGKPESFGRTTLEALSLGIPVIGYDHGGVGEILRYCFPQGLIPAGSENIDCERIQAVKSSPVQPTSKFSLSNMLAQTLALYQELLNERSRLFSS